MFLCIQHCPKILACCKKAHRLPCLNRFPGFNSPMKPFRHHSCSKTFTSWPAPKGLLSIYHWVSATELFQTCLRVASDVLTRHTLSPFSNVPSWTPVEYLDVPAMQPSKKSFVNHCSHLPMNEFILHYKTNVLCIANICTQDGPYICVSLTHCAMGMRFSVCRYLANAHASCW